MKVLWFVTLMLSLLLILKHHERRFVVEGSKSGLMRFGTHHF